MQKRILNELNSNLIFIAPVATGFIKNYYIYAFLAVSILFASTVFHYVKDKNHNREKIKIFRMLDIAIASICYLYMFYFISRYVTFGSGLLYSLLATTIGMYSIGKSSFGIKNNFHSFFHIAIGIIAGMIPLFA